MSNLSDLRSFILRLQFSLERASSHFGSACSFSSHLSSAILIGVHVAQDLAAQSDLRATLPDEMPMLILFYILADSVAFMSDGADAQADMELRCPHMAPT